MIAGIREAEITYTDISLCFGLFVGAIGVIGSVGFWLRDFFGANVHVPPLDHYTTKEAKAIIQVSSIIKCRGAIHAADERMRRHSVPRGRFIRLLTSYKKVCEYVEVPHEACLKFLKVRPMGLFTTFKRIHGHRFACYRRLDLRNSTFSEPDGWWAYVFHYGSDLAIYSVFFIVVAGGKI